MVETGSYYFLSRPRRFGKSLLVDTIEELFRGSRELFRLGYPNREVKESMLDGLLNAYRESTVGDSLFLVREQ